MPTQANNNPSPIKLTYTHTVLSTNSVWLLIDVQTKLWPVAAKNIRDSVLHNMQRLIQASQLLEIGLWVSEQYPEGLGTTIEPLKSTLSASATVFSKSNFSAWYEPSFQSHTDSKKPQVVIFGLETHICVLQTALDALSEGKTVFVVEDAVISRDNAYRDNALVRLREAGCIITNTESVILEPLGGALHPKFKNILKLIR